MSLTPTLIFPSCFLPIVHFRPLECAIATLERVFVKLRVKNNKKPYLHIFTEKRTRKVLWRYSNRLLTADLSFSLSNWLVGILTFFLLQFSPSDENPLKSEQVGRARCPFTPPFTGTCSGSSDWCGWYQSRTKQNRTSLPLILQQQWRLYRKPPNSRSLCQWVSAEQVNGTELETKETTFLHYQWFPQDAAVPVTCLLYGLPVSLFFFMFELWATLKLFTYFVGINPICTSLLVKKKKGRKVTF